MEQQFNLQISESVCAWMRDAHNISIERKMRVLCVCVPKKMYDIRKVVGIIAKWWVRL